MRHDEHWFPPGTQIIEFSPQEKLPFNKTYEMSFVNRFIKMREKLEELKQPIIDKIRTSKNSEFIPNFQTLLPCVTTSIGSLLVHRSSSFQCSSSKRSLFHSSCRRSTITSSRSTRPNRRTLSLVDLSLSTSKIFFLSISYLERIQREREVKQWSEK